MFARIVPLVVLLAAVGTSCGVLSSSESDAASRPDSTVEIGTLPDLADLPPLEVDDGALSIIGVGSDELTPGLVTVDGTPEAIAIVGDSLTQSAETEIIEAFAEIDLEPHVDGLANRRMISRSQGVNSGADVIEEIVEFAEPDLWIIALGTNDVGAGGSSELFEDDVRTILREIPDGAPVIWVDLWIRDRPVEILGANATIRDVLGDRPDTAVIDWHEYGDDEGIIAGDGVHLSEAGRVKFADLMANAVTAMFPQ